MTPAERADRIKQRARELGFHSCGITDLSPPPHANALRRWLDSGMAGTMRYMNRQAGKRTNPSAILEGASRAVVITRRYDNPDPPAKAGHGKVAKYARGPDYHDALEPPLNELAAYVRSLGDENTIARFYVDAGPVPERELAQRAGLGWIGKNTLLIDPTAGSYLFIAEILTNLDIALDEPFEADRCGSCTRCLEACPTNAFHEARVLDSRLCISYLTIEYRGPFDDDQPRLHDWLFGCDDCQTVCPWNVRFSETAEDPVLRHDPSLAQLELKALAHMTESEFAERFGRTALERPGHVGMQRNALRVGWEQKDAQPDRIRKGNHKPVG